MSNEKELKWERMTNEEIIEFNINSKRSYQHFLRELTTKNQIEYIQLIKYCSEGENVFQAMNNAHNLYNYLLIQENLKMIPLRDQQKLSWIAPPSWSNLIKGTTPRDLTMYY